MSRNRFYIPLLAAALLFLALPATASDGVVYNGIDVWHTVPVKTFADFRSEPIPAGFFCSGSAAFQGRIPLKGAPIATSNPGALAGVDTIVQRLDDAVFNERGIARTRIQFKAMQLVSVAPVKTACGQFNLLVTLQGQQPITSMRVVRSSEDGGLFIAPLALNVKMVFTPVGRKSNERFELVRAVRFPPARNAHWTFETNNKAQRVLGYVQIDTDADGQPDTYVPGTSNFATGRRSADKLATSDSTARLTFHENECATHIVN